jgi:hypothetical protein
MFTFEDADKLRELGRTLTSKYNIYTALSGHRDYTGMRVTPSVYSTLAEVDYFAAAVEQELRKAEVMAGLNDSELEASIQIVRKIRDQLNMTIIWVEHVMKAVMSLAERTVVINFGTVLTEGLPQEVMRHPAVIEAYLGKDLKYA